MATVSQRRFTINEYLDRELAAEQTGGRSSEFANGKIREMPGADWQHNVLVANFSSALASRLRGKSFAVCGSQMRVRVSESGPFYYPDATVIPVPPQIVRDRGQSLLNLIVIVEVTSPSTERIDRGEKLTNYRRIPALSDYVIVSHDSIEVEHHSRCGPDDWKSIIVNRLADSLRISSLVIELPLAEIYERVLPAES